MEKIAIITDSVADLPQDFIETNNIYIVNLYVVIDESYYEDRVEIRPEDLDKRNKENPSFSAKTSAPSPNDFSKVFKKVVEDGYKKAIYIGINPKLSSTFSNAKIAEKHGLKVEMINSGSVTLLENIIILYAVDLIKEGFSYQEIIDKINKVVGRQKAYTWFDTISYLKAGGRLGRAAKKASTILNIKPILSLDGNGDFDLIKLKAKKEKSFEIIEKKLREDLKNAKKYYLTYISGTDKSVLDGIKERIQDLDQRAENVLTSSFGSVISAHAGSKVYAVGYLEIED